MCTHGRRLRSRKDCRGNCTPESTDVPFFTDDSAVAALRRNRKDWLRGFGDQTKHRRNPFDLSLQIATPDQFHSRPVPATAECAGITCAFGFGSSVGRDASHDVAGCNGSSAAGCIRDRRQAVPQANRTISVQRLVPAGNCRRLVLLPTTPSRQNRAEIACCGGRDKDLPTQRVASVDMKFGDLLARSCSWCFGCGIRCDIKHAKRSRLKDHRLVPGKLIRRTV